MLEANKLTKKFGAFTALDSLDLKIVAGETVCLLGANGAGKTTTINLFLGFLEPSSGNAFVNGLNVQSSPLESKKHLAYIPEQVALYPQLTGLENLNYFLRLSGVRKSQNELVSILKDADLPEGAIHKRAASYSKGMRQKVGIAIALAKNAKALLLDEPLSGLDPSAANALSGSLAKLRDEGHAILMATHDVFRAKEIGTRIGIMKSGHLVNTLDASSLDASEIEKIYLAHMHDANENGASA